MLATRTSISDVIQVTPQRFTDERGYFMETFQLSNFRDATGTQISFVQENQSLSLKKNTVRGLHFQSPPNAQSKLVRCLQGSILDIAVDIRKGSPTYKHSVAIKLTSNTDNQLWIPTGFLHGIRTLEDNTIVNYKCTEYYMPDYEGIISWDDPDLAIKWGIDTPASISERDMTAKKFGGFSSPFQYSFSS